MVEFKTTILKFNEKGEKTGWTYIEVPADVAQRLKRNNKKSFRVKGRLDAFSIRSVALIPMGGGTFIMPINAAMRKGIGKRHGAVLAVILEVDNEAFVFDCGFVECLSDEPAADNYFKTLAGSHQRYFSKWIMSAKTEATKAKRIAQAVNALSRKEGYPEMMRALKAKR